MSRHRDAIGIQQGACNPSAIALAIIAACKEVREEISNAPPNARVTIWSQAVMLRKAKKQKGV